MQGTHNSIQLSVTNSTEEMKTKILTLSWVKAGHEIESEHELPFLHTPALLLISRPAVT